MKSTNLKSWDDSICWYCKKIPVGDGEHNEQVMLNRLLKKKQTYLVTAMTYKMNYESKKVEVPCCVKCAKASAKVFSLFFILWLISSITIWAWSIYTAIVTEEEEFFINAFANPIGLALMLAIPLYLIFAAVNRMFIMRADNSDYPAIQALLSEGWKLGEEPDRHDEVVSK